MEDPLLACKNAYFYIKELKPPKTLNLGGIKKMYRDFFLMKRNPRLLEGFYIYFLYSQRNPPLIQNSQTNPN